MPHCTGSQPDRSADAAPAARPIAMTTLKQPVWSQAELNLTVFYRLEALRSLAGSSVILTSSWLLNNAHLSLETYADELQMLQVGQCQSFKKGNPPADWIWERLPTVDVANREVVVQLSMHTVVTITLIRQLRINQSAPLDFTNGLDLATALVALAGPEALLCQWNWWAEAVGDPSAETIADTRARLLRAGLTEHEVQQLLLGIGVRG